MDWTQILVTVIGLFGAVDLGRILFFKSSKKKANAEADSAAVEPLKAAIEILNQQLLDANSRLSEKDEQIEAKQAEITNLRSRLQALYDDMCIHKGCKLRKPHQGQGMKWYEDHADDPSLGCDYYSVEWLLKGWRKRNNIEETPNNNTNNADAETTQEV